MKSKLNKQLYSIVIGIVLTILTTISLIFTDAPYYIYSNISGLTLVTAMSGTIVGIIFSLVISISKLLMNLSTSIITAELLKNITEVIIITFIFTRNKKMLFKTVSYLLSLTIIVKPLYFFYYYILNSSSYNTIENMYSNISNYYKNDLIKTLIVYLFSIIVSYAFIFIYNKLFKKTNRKGVII